MTLMRWDPEGVAAWAERAGQGGVLVQSMRGFIDAGKVGKLICEHLVSDVEPIRIVTFEIDELLDYRSRRPEMTFSINQWTNYDEPYLAVDMVADAQGTPFLVLHGLEPDIRWEAFASSVRDIVTKLGVGLLVGAHGIPMAVPHSKPLQSTVHGTRQDLLPDSPSMFGTVNVPASAQNLLEYRFGQWGIDSVTVAVHVPYYLSQSALPQAAQHALEKIEDITGLQLSRDNLDDAAAVASEEIARQLAESDEIQALVETLEAQYDAMQEAREAAMPVDGMLPTADEIAAEFEKFLASERRDLPPNP